MEAIVDLIERFDRNLEAYHSGQYNETQVRIEFIDPLFKALGWDVDNVRGYAEAYKDVVHEDAIKIGGYTKAPDYCFRIGGARKFFVEAKKPSVSLREEISPAYQLRRYAWSAKLPLSILTDFEEFAVYDCRVRPVATDKASKARVLYVRYTEYPDRWDEIATIFSREAVLKGSFDKYAESTRRKRGTAEVDAAFLQEIDSWRDELARNLALRNPALSQRELNYAVQRTIDRLIFLRICEDRGIELYGRLQALLNGGQVYARLCDLYRQADERYNSGLFHFRHEKGRGDPDELTPNLTVDDRSLKGIIKRLYYPDSPYEFSVLPADILGQVYEQFLGKVIRLTPGHQARVEEKPEVKKAGGVYYTPTYIVDYIVRHTVGELLKDKTPRQAARLRILDPACGSGSFLLGAYQCLLDWHLEYYEGHDPESWAARRNPRLFQGRGGEWRLTTAERKRILLNNIYGVDIDSQAVEVTKLSLLLKVLEGETGETLARQLAFYHQRALPDLATNIKCGNSLIGTDFHQAQQTSFLDEEEIYRINAFDWETEFAEIMAAGGFDAVIGNPPYIFTRGRGIDESQKAYFYAHYYHQSAQLNTFGIFVERFHYLARGNGMLGFITPNNWLTTDSFAPLRKFLAERANDLRIANVLDRVFAAANVDTAVLVLTKGKPHRIIVAEILNKNEVSCHAEDMSVLEPPSYIIQISLLQDPRARQLLREVESVSEPLREFCRVSTGLKAYQTGKGKPPQTDEHKRTRTFHATCKLDETYGRYLTGADVSRYLLAWSGEFLSYGKWLAEPRRSVPFRGERLLVRQIPAKPPYLVHGVFADEAFYNDINSMVVFSPLNGVSLKYLLGLVNSRLLSFWFLRTYDKLQRRIFPQFKVKELASFPIATIDFSDPADVARHDRMVALVERMLALHVQLAAARTPAAKTTLQRHIAATDRQIDGLVYTLYELTEEEIGIVEGGA